MRARITEIADIGTGYHFRERLDMASDGTHCVIQIKDIDPMMDHRLVATSLYRVTPKTPVEKHLVRNGDILFLSKGRRNYATVVEDLPGFTTGSIAAGYFFVLRLKSQNVLPAYLAWYINQAPAQNFLQGQARGSAMPFIPRAAFELLEVDIPLLNVQQTIVRLHQLSLREQALSRLIEERRKALVQALCLSAAKRENQQ